MVPYDKIVHALIWATTSVLASIRVMWGVEEMIGSTFWATKSPATHPWITVAIHFVC